MIWFVLTALFAGAACYAAARRVDRGTSLDREVELAHMRDAVRGAHEGLSRLEEEIARVRSIAGAQAAERTSAAVRRAIERGAPRDVHGMATPRCILVRDRSIIEEEPCNDVESAR